LHTLGFVPLLGQSPDGTVQVGAERFQTQKWGQLQNGTRQRKPGHLVTAEDAVGNVRGKHLTG